MTIVAPTHTLFTASGMMPCRIIMFDMSKNEHTTKARRPVKVELFWRGWSSGVIPCSSTKAPPHLRPRHTLSPYCPVLLSNQKPIDQKGEAMSNFVPCGAPRTCGVTKHRVGTKAARECPATRRNAATGRLMSASLGTKKPAQPQITKKDIAEEREWVEVSYDARQAHDMRWVANFAQPHAVQSNPQMGYVHSDGTGKLKVTAGSSYARVTRMDGEEYEFFMEPVSTEAITKFVDGPGTMKSGRLESDATVAYVDGNDEVVGTRPPNGVDADRVATLNDKTFEYMDVTPARTYRGIEAVKVPCEPGKRNAPAGVVAMTPRADGGMDVRYLDTKEAVLQRDNPGSVVPAGSIYVAESNWANATAMTKKDGTISAKFVTSDVGVMHVKFDTGDVDGSRYESVVSCYKLEEPLPASALERF